jgi:hypothetical protein
MGGDPTRRNLPASRTATCGDVCVFPSDILRAVDWFFPLTLSSACSMRQRCDVMSNTECNATLMQHSSTLLIHPYVLRSVEFGYI